MKLIFLMLSIFTNFNREQLAKENQRKGKIRNASSTGAEFLVAANTHVMITLNSRAFIFGFDLWGYSGQDK